MIIVCINEQCLYHRRITGTWHSYPVSTAKNGTGNQRNSYQTPLGNHRICQKIGHAAPPFTIFKARQPIGIYSSEHHLPGHDYILSRILWLEGMQTGINRRGTVDSRKRYIYIHGTDDEKSIGSPVSHGCIRMRNRDIIELFEHARIREKVIISESFRPKHHI